MTKFAFLAIAGLILGSLSGTVLEVRGDGNAHALLKQAGFMPKPGRFLALSVDSDEKLYLWALAALAFVDEKGMNHHLEPVRQIIHTALQRIQSEDPNLFQEIKRRVPMLLLRRADARTQFPFGCALALATPLVVFYGAPFWQAYLGMLG